MQKDNLIKIVEDKNCIISTLEPENEFSILKNWNSTMNNQLEIQILWL